MDFAGIKPKAASGEYQESGHGIITQKHVPSPPLRGQSFLNILGETSVLPTWQQHIFGSHTFHELQNYWPTRVCRDHRFKYHRNIAWKLDFPFASDLYASYSFEGMRKAPGPKKIGQRLFQDYLRRPAEELFDLENDPDEVHNLASNPEYRDTLLKMRKITEQWQLDTHDVWLLRDGASVEKLRRYGFDGLTVPDQFDMSEEVGEDTPWIKSGTIAK